MNLHPFLTLFSPVLLSNVLLFHTFTDFSKERNRFLSGRWTGCITQHESADPKPHVGVVASGSGSGGILLAEGVWKPQMLRLLIPSLRDLYFYWFS